MTQLLVCLVLSLATILVAAELFTNALEHLGERLGISEGVTGSLFAAVGTALPETLVPLLALFSGATSTSVNEEIGVGAILGAPLMLSTLSSFLLLLAVLRQRGIGGRIQPEVGGFRRDLNFFIVAFLLAAAAMYVPHSTKIVRLGLSLTLVVLYGIYVYTTFRASKGLVEDGHGTQAPGTLMLAHLRMPTNLLTIGVQLLGALALLVGGAKGFIYGVQGAAHLLGISPLLLALLVIPIATELPEKVNSILWVRRGKDTLAFGNITGAMVFQGTLLPAIGIMLTPWEPRVEVLTGILLTLFAAIWLRLNARSAGLPVWALAGNGILYATYLYISLTH